MREKKESTIFPVIKAQVFISLSTSYTLAFKRGLGSTPGRRLLPTIHLAQPSMTDIDDRLTLKSRAAASLDFFSAHSMAFSSKKRHSPFFSVPLFTLRTRLQQMNRMVFGAVDWCGMPSQWGPVFNQGPGFNEDPAFINVAAWLFTSVNSRLAFIRRGLLFQETR